MESRPVLAESQKHLLTGRSSRFACLGALLTGPRTTPSGSVEGRRPLAALSRETPGEPWKDDNES